MSVLASTDGVLSLVGVLFVAILGFVGIWYQVRTLAKNNTEDHGRVRKEVTEMKSILTDVRGDVADTKGDVADLRIGMEGLHKVVDEHGEWHKEHYQWHLRHPVDERPNLSLAEEA